MLHPARRPVSAAPDAGAVSRFGRMTTYGVRRRVACYVTRTTETGEQLLVFDHRDDDPDDPSGTQIPAGGMLPFEAIVDAAAREIEEETGLADTTFVGSGRLRRARPGRSGRARR